MFLVGLGCIKDKNGNKREKILELVPNKSWKVLNQPKLIPRAFLVLAGSKTIAKVRLCNELLVNWQINIKKKAKVKEGKCPFYSPSTQNVELRTT